MQRLHGDRQRCAPQLRVDRLGLDKILAHRDGQHVVFFGQRGVARAFQDLAGVPGRCLGQPAVRRKGYPGRRIRATTREDDLGALFKRGPVWLGAHHPDDTRGAVDHLFGGRRRGAQRAHLAGANLVFQEGLILLRVNQRHFEVEVVFAGDFPDDVGAFLQVRLCARASAGADHHRYAVGDRAAHQQFKVTLHRHPGVQALAGTQVVWAGIRTAAIDPDHVGLELERGFQRGGREPIAQDAADRHHRHRLSCFAHLEVTSIPIAMRFARAASV